MERINPDASLTRTLSQTRSRKIAPATPPVDFFRRGRPCGWKSRSRRDRRPAAAGGQFLARAAYSPSSQIRARVWTFDPSEPVDVTFFRRRIGTAIAARAAWHMPPGTDALRLIHAESMTCLA